MTRRKSGGRHTLERVAWCWYRLAALASVSYPLPSLFVLPHRRTFCESRGGQRHAAFPGNYLNTAKRLLPFCTAFNIVLITRGVGLMFYVDALSRSRSVESSGAGDPSRSACNCPLPPRMSFATLPSSPAYSLCADLLTRARGRNGVHRIVPLALPDSQAGREDPRAFIHF